MDLLQTMLCSEESEKFSQNLITIISTSKKYWFLCIDFKHFGILTFCVYFNFLSRYCLPMSVQKDRQATDYWQIYSKCRTYSKLF